MRRRIRCRRGPCASADGSTTVRARANRPVDVISGPATGSHRDDAGAELERHSLDREDQGARASRRPLLRRPTRAPRGAAGGRAAANPLPTPVNGLAAVRPTRSVFGKSVVWKAVQPALARLRRRNHRMRRSARMFRGVPVRRRVAAQRGPARLTRPQVNPPRSDLDALLTLAGFRLHDGLNGIDVRARTSHGGVLPLDDGVILSANLL